MTFVIDLIIKHLRSKGYIAYAQSNFATNKQSITYINIHACNYNVERVHIVNKFLAFIACDDNLNDLAISTGTECEAISQSDPELLAKIDKFLTITFS